MVNWLKVMVLSLVFCVCAAALPAQTVTVNGKDLDVAVVEKNGKIYAEMVGFAKALGATFAYDKASKTLTVTGKSGKVKVPTIIEDEKPYADAVAFAKAAGATAKYDNEAEQLIVTTAKAGSAVMGTDQREGIQAEFEKSYTIGKEHPINFCLLSAEFTTTRVNIADNTYCPTAEEKLLVIHYTLQNPLKEERAVDWESLNFTVVDAENANHDYESNVGTEGNGEVLNMSLKPAQKVALYAIFRVPAKGVIPKLIVLPPDGGVLRYDLHGKVKGLSAPVADPEVKDGSAALPEIPAKLNEVYAAGFYDIKVEKWAFSTKAILETEPEEGMRYLILTLRVKNQTKIEQEVWPEDFQMALHTKEGESFEWNSTFLAAGADRETNIKLRKGEEGVLRCYFSVPKDATLKDLSVRDIKGGYASDPRPVLFDLSEVK